MGEAMQVEQSLAADHLLHLGASVAFAQHANEFEFAIGARGKVSVAGFGWNGLPAVVASTSTDVRLAHSSASCDHGSRPCHVGSAVLQCDELVGSQHFD